MKILLLLVLIVPTSLFAQTVSGLVALYPCNGNFNDVSGNGKNGIVSGPALTEDKNGNLSSAYRFDGVDDFVSTPVIGPYTAFTLMARIKSTSAALMNIFAGNDAAWYPSLQSGKVAWFDGAAWRQSATLVNDNKWHDIAYIFNNGIYTIYVDGIFEYSGQGAAAIVSGQVNGFGKIGNNQRYFDGSIDDISIYNRALAHTEVVFLFGAPQPIAGQCEWACDNSILFTVGSVAIGTTDPKGYKLAIAGKAIAEEIVVKLQSSWPDYVFESNYKLPSLFELEKFIIINKHLPGVPSATEVKENGLSVGEMNSILLKKVEELTLYLLKQEKTIAEQNERLLKLENKK